MRIRLLVRNQQHDQAIVLSDVLLQQFPQERGVAEDLIELQVKEQRFDDAIRVSQRLVESTSDVHERLLMQLRLAKIYLSADQRPNALQVYREALVSAGSDSWVEREVIAQIERLFRAKDDLEGLGQLLAELEKQHPDRLHL